MQNPCFLPIHGNASFLIYIFHIISFAIFIVLDCEKITMWHCSIKIPFLKNQNTLLPTHFNIHHFVSSSSTLNIYKYSREIAVLELYKCSFNLIIEIEEIMSKNPWFFSLYYDKVMPHYFVYFSNSLNFQLKLEFGLRMTICKMTYNV